MSKMAKKSIDGKDLLDVCVKWQKDKHAEGKGKKVVKVVEKKKKKKRVVSKVATKEAVDRTRKVLEVQSKRLKEYEVFENALRDLLRSELKSADVQKYQRICSEITKRFSTLSNAVRKIETALSSSNKENEEEETYLRDIVRDIQNMEREKLHMVARYHLLRLHDKQGSLRPEDKPSIELLASSIDSCNRDLALRSADLESFANLTCMDS